MKAEIVADRRELISQQDLLHGEGDVVSGGDRVLSGQKVMGENERPVAADLGGKRSGFTSAVAAVMAAVDAKLHEELYRFKEACNNREVKESDSVLSIQVV